MMGKVMVKFNSKGVSWADLMKAYARAKNQAFTNYYYQEQTETERLPKAK